MKHHTRQRVKEIDKFLIEFYPTDGAASCAETLKEPLSYIKNRAHNINLTLTTEARRKPGAVRRNESEKIISLEKNIRTLKRHNQDLEKRNHDLRLNLIKVVGQNRELREYRDEFDI